MNLMNVIGEDALRRTTQTLYALVLADDELSRFFDGYDVNQIEARQRQFLSYVLAGDGGTPPVDLRKVHAPLLALGLNHDHFDRLLGHVDTALEEAGVARAVRAEVDARLEATRAEVLGETYSHFDTKEKSMIGRVVSMAYAVFCYAAGMAVLAYTAAWLGGFVVPNQLDAPAVGSLAVALLVNVGLVLVFGVQHSVMARPAFKNWWTRWIPPHCERSTYVLASSIALFVLMWFWQPIGIDIWRLEGSAMIAAYVMYGVGWFVLVTSTFFLNHFDLFGLRQAWLNLRGKAYTHIPFNTPGYYRFVRHPIYVGWLVLIWATPTMTVSHLVFALATTAYILSAIPLEEKDLETLLPEYKNYKKTTPALVPGTSGKAPRPAHQA